MKIISNVLFFSLAITLFTNLNALSLKEGIQETIKNNPEIKAEIHNQEAYKKYVDEKQGNYLPTLDLTAYQEKNTTKNDYENSSTSTKVIKHGWNANLTLEQILYNGGFTGAEVDEQKSNQLANKHRSIQNIESVLINSLNSYLGLVQYKELLSLTKDMVQINDDNLVTAKDKEEISGEILETYQVSSKLHFAQEKYQEQEEELEKNENNFKRYIGITSPKLVCRPIINSNNIPKTLEKTIELAVINSHKVLEALANIQVQQAKLAQADSRFLPTLKLRLESTWDDDLELANNGREDEYLIRLNMTWNLFNGASDYYVSQREQKFLLEAKKTLDSVTDEVVADVKTAYFKYHKNLQRVKTLKALKEDNRNIVDIYKQEFDAGTRTFIDILNAESELYQADTSLVNREFVLFNDYYELLFNLSTLSKTVLASKNQVCKEIIKKEIKKMGKEDLGDLSEVEALEELNDEKEEDLNMKEETKVDYTSYLEAPENYYTINLATFDTLNAAQKYINDNSIESLSFSFEFGEETKQTKIIYGIYKGLTPAREAMKELSEVLLKNKPYIDNLGKHQRLYKKYN